MKPIILKCFFKKTIRSDDSNDSNDSNEKSVNERNSIDEN